jgi:hypothetical protein
LLAGVEAWPLSLGALGVLFALMARVPRPQKRDAWRAACLFLLVTCAVVVLAEPGRSLERVLPRFADGVTVERIYANAGFALCWVLLYERRRDPFHAVLLAAGFLAFACALFDARFQVTLQVVLAASISALVADPIGASGASAQRVSRAVLALVLAATAVLPWLVAQPVEIALQREFAGGLRWLRTGSSSPGPFNSPDAGQDWRVWTAPRLAGSVAYHARRPLVASSVGSASFGPALDAGDEGFLARLDEEIALFVVATPRMLEDASLGEDRPLSALRTLERFALDGGEPPPGWRRVHATSTRVGPDGRAALDGERGGPLVSIWRRESAAAGALPTMKQ